jgi:hypothetical protein
MLICPSLKSAFDAKKGTGTDKWIHLHLSIKIIPFFIRIYRDYRPISGRSLSFMRYVGNKTAIPRVDWIIKTPYCEWSAKSPKTSFLSKTDGYFKGLVVSD